MCTTLSDGSRISDRKINWHVPPSRHPSRMQILSSLRIRTVENGRWKLDKYRKLKTESSYRLAEIKWQRAAHLDTWFSSEKRQPNRVRLNWISVNTRDFCFSSLPLSLSLSIFLFFFSFHPNLWSNHFLYSPSIHRFSSGRAMESTESRDSINIRAWKIANERAIIRLSAESGNFRTGNGPDNEKQMEI